MITLFNVWHYLVLFIILAILVAGIVIALKQPQKKLVFPVIISVVLICTLLAGFSLVAVDKYTKVVKLYKMKNKRLLSIEKIVYSGIVKNEGSYEIGEVTFEIKIVNKGHVIGKAQGANFFEASGFFDFFSGGANILYNKPQTIVKEFVVAKNLKPGKAKSFRVYFDYPSYFSSVSHFGKVHGDTN